jgi:hypothetical protein
VDVVLVHDNVVYAGGLFGTIGGQNRQKLAALDPATGVATSWNPSVVGGQVMTLAVRDQQMYAGGNFASVGGQSRDQIAAIDLASGLATPWAPDVNGVVREVVIHGSNVVVGGEMHRVDGYQRHYLGSIADPITVGVPGAPISEPPSLAMSVPNPSRVSSNVRFELPADARVTLELFDVAGRQVHRVLDQVSLGKGPHEARLELDGFGAGVYCAVLRTDDWRESRKFVLIP